MTMDEIRITDGFDNMNFEDVTDMLAQSYWSPGIGQAEVRQGAFHSALVVGAFAGDKQIGYCRAVSDCTRSAYISDVYVHADYRHLGIAQRMMEHMLGHEKLKDVYQWVLRSAAHELYHKLGFKPLFEGEKWMEIRHQRPDRRDF